VTRSLQGAIRREDTTHIDGKPPQDKSSTAETIGDKMRWQMEAQTIKWCSSAQDSPKTQEQTSPRCREDTAWLGKGRMGRIRADTTHRANKARSEKKRSRCKPGRSMRPQDRVEAREGIMGRTTADTTDTANNARYDKQKSKCKPGRSMRPQDRVEAQEGIMGRTTADTTERADNARYDKQESKCKPGRSICPQDKVKAQVKVKIKEDKRRREKRREEKNRQHKTR